MNQATIRVAINQTYGGYSFSNAAIQRLKDLGYKFQDEKYPLAELQQTQMRCHPLVIQVIDELGKESFGKCAVLGTVVLPEGLKDYYSIDEFDGSESIKIEWERWLTDNLGWLDSESVEEWKSKLSALL